MFSYLLLYCLAAGGGGVWSLYLLASAGTTAEVQASISPVVIGYLIAEAFEKSRRRLVESNKELARLTEEAARKKRAN